MGCFVEGWKTVGVDVTQTNGRSVWSCPNRLGYSSFSAANQQYVCGCQYYGGITKWNTPLGTYASASPVKATTSNPSWMLATDFVAERGGNWSPMAQTPAHKDTGEIPAGGNEVLIDGSASWVQGKKMLSLHNCGGSSPNPYFHQDDLGVLEPQRAQLTRVK